MINEFEMDMWRIWNSVPSNPPDVLLVDGEVYDEWWFELNGRYAVPGSDMESNVVGAYAP